MKRTVWELDPHLLGPVGVLAEARLEEGDVRHGASR